MSISRSCWSCGNQLPEHLSDGTCPTCGTPQAGRETPKDLGTKADQNQEFVVDLPDERTGTHRPERELQSTILAELGANGIAKRRNHLQLAGYRDVSWLNSGGMGDVYRGIQSGTERPVAIKVMRSSLANYSLNRERFENEIRALGRVDHPGVVRVFECGESDFGPYFSMEFVDGETLARRIKREGMLDVHEAVRIVRQAAEAVHCAHKVRVLHRDLKPSNIMIGSDGSVKVTDFGLAKETERDDTNPLTQSGVIIGTPSYIPPEQAECRFEDVGPRSDVYGLGGTLYHLVTGSAPHFSQTPSFQIQKASSHEICPPSELRPDLCPILAAIIEKSLAYDPKDRYDSAEQFAKELSNWSTGEPTLASPPTLLQRQHRWFRRNRLAVQRAVLALMMMIVGIAAAIVGLQPDQKSRIAQALARGDAVTLIGSTGEPKWHNWIMLPGLLGPSQTGDGACGLQSQRYSGLMLVDDPMNDHYRVRADLLHYGGMRSNEGMVTGNPSSKIGLFWGYHKLQGNGPTADVMFSLDFNDLSRNTPADPNADDQPQSVRVHARFFTFLPNLGVRTQESGLTKSFDFKSQGDEQRIYRTLEIEVHPEGCSVSFAAKAGDPLRRVASLTREDFESARESVLRGLNAVHPADWSLPDWTPRRPLGILGNLSTLSIRNVVIEPLPAP